MTNPERRLAELGIELPPASKPIGTYVPSVQVGNLLFLSGLGPRRPDGSFVAGKVGADVTLEQGREAARIVGLNMLANIRAALGSLDRVERVVKTLGMVNSAPDFDQLAVDRHDRAHDAEINRKEHADRNQRDLRALEDAEPEDEQRHPGDRRDRAQRLQGRIEKPP